MAALSTPLLLSWFRRPPVVASAGWLDIFKNLIRMASWQMIGLTLMSSQQHTSLPLGSPNSWVSCCSCSMPNIFYSYSIYICLIVFWPCGPGVDALPVLFLSQWHGVDTLFVFSLCPVAMVLIYCCFLFLPFSSGVNLSLLLLTLWHWCWSSEGAVPWPVLHSTCFHVEHICEGDTATKPL